MTLRIQRNTDESLKTDRVAHTADMLCDVCGVAQSAVNFNTVATYGKNISGDNACIALKCSDIGGLCDSVTCWPLVNGTVDAIELALVKTA